MAVSLTPAGYFLSRRRSVQRTCNSHRRSRGQNGHRPTVVTHTGPPVGLTGGIPKLATLVPDLSPTPCTLCAPSRWILAASTQPRAPGETRADLGVKRLRHPIACHACPKTLRSHAFSRRLAHRMALGNSFDGLADRDRRRPERMAALRGMVDLDPQHWSRREPTLLGTGVFGRRTLDERPSARTKILLTLVLTPASSGIVNMGRNGFACGTVHVPGEEHGAA